MLDASLISNLHLAFRIAAVAAFLAFFYFIKFSDVLVALNLFHFLLRHFIILLTL